MGYDATSGERNTTGHHIETQALTFVGSTARPQIGQKLEGVGGNSRGYEPLPKPAPTPSGATCHGSGLLSSLAGGPCHRLAQLLLIFANLALLAPR